MYILVAKPIILTKKIKKKLNEFILKFNSYDTPYQDTELSFIENSSVL